ncbi:BMP family protein [Paenibacillus pasadenensis]|uniref:Membrane lipoprotein n=2 Tax=Paenibacillus TaxID=44249 RepID=A0A2N5N3R0_9BACL|nr:MULTISPECIES: BMP family protein [Paenibacillus]PLT44929.1 membrane lipoprotein [Paenibacillus pasadenensis]
MKQQENGRKRLGKRSRMRTSRLIALLLALTLLLAGCGGNKAAGTTAKPEAEAAGKSGFKVALLTPGAVNDNGWNSVAYNGLLKIKDVLGADTQHSEKVGQSDAAEFIRGYAQDGFQVVIGHGFEYAEPMMEIAKEFPDTWFLVTSAAVSQEPNVASISINNREQGYLMGTAAALLSKSGKVAAIGGTDIPPITNSVAGFKEGAEAAVPGIEVFTAMTGSNDDIAKAKETAISMIEKGADVVMANANAAGNGGIEAAKQKGVLSIGSNVDLNALAPDTVAVSVIQDYPAAMASVVKDIKEGRMKAEPKMLGVKEGAVYLSPYHGFESSIPQAVKDKIEAVFVSLHSGELQVKNEQ